MARKMKTMDGNHAAAHADTTPDGLGTVDHGLVFGDGIVFYSPFRWISDPGTAVLVETDGGKSDFRRRKRK